jgi:hypothetical protein
MIVPYGSAGMFPRVTICRQRVAQIDRLSHPAECLLTNGSKVTLAPLIAAHIAPGDDLSFPLPNSSTATAEILYTKNSLAESGWDVYQAPIGYVTQPKKDKRDEFFVAAEVRPANLGISSIFLPCKTLREYFYRTPERAGSTGRQTLYDVLQLPCTAAPGELRVAFKLRQLELEAKHCPRSEYVLLERAFNILGDPGLRACYDALLKDPAAPTLFPMVGSAHCWFPANGRTTYRRFSPGASLRSCQSGTSGASMRHCANVSSIRTALFTATSEGSSSFGSILPSSTRSGMPLGTDGSTSSDPGWRSRRPS